MTSALVPRRWSRRTLLTGAAALAVGGAGLVGCGAVPGGPAAPDGSSSTAPGGGTTPPGTHLGSSPDPARSPVPVFPGSVEGAVLEAALADQASTLLAVGGKTLGPDGRRLVTAIRDQHLAHAATLRTTDPTDPNSTESSSIGPPTTSPSTPQPGKPPGFAKAVERLAAAESKAAATHRASALAATGLAALLWGSMASSAAAVAAIVTSADLAGDDPDPTVATVAAARPRAPMPVITAVQAEQELVRQLHAVVYGYQLALGRLTGKRRDAATAELRRHRILRDRLSARLLDRKAEVPVAAAAYVPSTNPRNAKSAAKLIRQLETALVPFCGLWLAAATTPGERAEALGQLGRTAAVARQWGAALPAWPGWKLG